MAYAAVQRPRAAAAARVREYAGSETALFAALGAAARYYEAPGVEVVAMPGTEDLPGCCETPAPRRRSSPSRARWASSMWMASLPASIPTCARASGPTAEALFLDPRETNGINFEYGRACTLANRGQLTALVFGESTEEATEHP